MLTLMGDEMKNCIGSASNIGKKEHYRSMEGRCGKISRKGNNS